LKTLSRLILLSALLVATIGAVSQCEVDAGPDVTICAGESVQLGGSPTVISGGSPSVTWDNGAANVDNPSVSPGFTTTYTVELAANGGCTDTDDITVTVLPAPTADFSFGPNGACAGTAVNFINESIGCAGCDYNWDFDNPASGASNNSTLSDPSHVFVVSGGGSQTFDVTLTVTAPNGCSDSETISVSVQESPTAILNEDVNFTQCLGFSQFFAYVTDASTPGGITNYYIDWGDLSPVYDSPVAPNFLEHIYNGINIWELTYTVTGPNDCENTSTYTVTNISNPAIGAGTNGNTLQCGPVEMCFDLSNYGGNHISTEYVIDYGDGSPTVTLPHPPPAQVCHEYSTSSCPGSFVFEILAQNNCPIQSVATISPIQIYSPPFASFFGPPVACVNTSVAFTNTSIPGANLSCSTATTYSWDYGDGTGATTSSSHVYTLPGTYTVTLTASNSGNPLLSCGSTTWEQDICIETAPTASIGIDANVGCVPMVVDMTNNSLVGIPCALATTWEVFYSDNPCAPNSGSYSYVGGTNSSSLEPQFSLQSAGVYTISYEMENTCGLFIDSEVVTVNTVPEVDVNDLPDICEGESVAPGAYVNGCNLPIISYAWTMPGGSPAAAGTASPGSVLYANSGNYSVSLTVTNACGPSSSSEPIVVQAAPIVSISATEIDLQLCQGNSTVLTASGANSYTWTANPTLSTTSGAVTTATPTVTTNYVVTGYTSAGCPGTQNITITVDPLPAVSAAASYEICAGDDVVIGAAVVGGEAPYTNYAWSPGATLDFTNIPNPTADPLITTNYGVWVTDNNGCLGYGVVPVVVNQLPIVDAGPNAQLCDQPVAEQLTGFSPVPVLPEIGVWTGPNVTAGGQFTPSGLGIFNLTYTFTDANGCVSSDMMSVEVINPQSADAGPDVELCAGPNDIILVPNTPGGQWTGSNVALDGTFTPSTDGVFTLTYTLGGGSCLSSDQIDVEVFELPVSDAGIDLEICAGDSIQLDGQLSGGTLPYNTISWTPNATLSADDINDPWADPVLSQVYSLQVIDDNGCVATDDVFVNVNASPIVEAGPNLVICNQPITEQLVGFGPIPGAGETGIWSGSNVDAGGLFTPSGTGTFWLYYTFTNALGCENLDSLTVDVIDPTQANAGPDFGICLNAPGVQLPQPGSWSGTDVTVGGLFSPNQSGTFNLVYTLGVGTCETTDNVDVTVYTLPVADAGADQVICEADGVQLSGSGAGDNMPVVDYTWSGGIGLDQYDIQNPFATPATTQIYTLTITDQVGCEDTDNVQVAVNSLPIVDAGPNLTVCDQPIPEVLVGFSPLPILPETGVWSGTGISDPDGEFTSPGVGNYWIYYTFTDAVGCINLDSLQVDVVAPVVADAGPDQEICYNEGPYQLVGFAPLVGVTWSGTGITDAAAGIFDPLVSGDGTFTLTIEYGAGTCYSVDDLEILVNPLPSMSPGPDETICGNLSPFDLSGFSPASGTWEGPGITDGVLGTFDPIIGVGDYDVYYFYTDPLTNCTDTVWKVVTVSPVPSAGFTLAPLGCTDASVDWTNTSSGGTTYQWDLGNNDVIVGFEPPYIYADEGFYDVELLVTNAFGCQDSLTINNEIIDPPSPALALLPDEGCAPLSVDFQNLSVGQYLTYVWELSIGTSTAFEPPTQVYAQGPDVLYYPIILTATNFCGSVIVEDTVTVLPQPVAGFGTNLDVFCSPFTVVFNNTSVGNPTTWEWDFGDNTFSDVEEPGEHIYTTGVDPTDYIITLIATNDCGIDTADYTITVLPNTVTAFFNTNITQGCAPLEVEFTDFSEGGTVIEWDFGDDSFSNLDSPTHTFTEEGSYTVYQYVNNGCSYDTTSIGITVFASPLLDFETDVPNVCENQPVQFINLSQGVSNVTWDFGDGSLPSNETNPFHTYIDGGNYTVTLTGVSSGNACQAVIQQSFQVFQTPDAGFTMSDDVGCSPFTVNFTNITAGGVFYQWDFDDDNTDNDVNTSNTFYNTSADPALYTITLIAQNMQLCADTFELNVIVSPTPIVDFDLSTYESCYFPVQLAFTNNTQFANGYDWDFGFLGSSSLFQPALLLNSVGTYPITLTASNSYGCIVSASDEVVIHPLPELEVIADVQSGCVPIEVNFGNLSEGGAIYEWDLGDGTVSFNVSPFHVYDTPGIFDVNLVATTDQGCMDTLLLEEFIEVYNLPWAGFTFSPEEPDIYEAEIQFEDLSYDASVWVWNFGDGQSSVEQHPLHTYLEAGWYEIELTVYNEHGCKNKNEDVLYIEDLFNIYVPNTFTPDGDNINEVFLPQVVGKGLLQFYELKIFDRWGIKVFETNDPEEPWLGDFQGHGDYYVADDVYVWQIKVRISGDDESRFFYGHVNMLR
jgi:large repetitive protein